MLNRCLILLCHNRPIWVWRYSLVTERCSQTMSKGNFTPTPPYDFNWTLVHWYGSNEHWCNNMSRRLLKDVAPTQLLIYSSNNFYRTKRIYMYIFCFLIKKVMKDACLFHIKGTTSLLICYPWESLFIQTFSYTGLCVVPSTSITGNSSISKFWTFVVYHPNYYFSSQLSHVERKSVACKLKAATSWLHKKVF